MRYILLFQGLYFLVTAIWPLADIDSFMLITGPKTDIWLVKTCGGLILAIAIALIVNVFSKKMNLPVIVLALTSSFILAYVDIYYAVNNIIPKVYLLDAVIEIIFMFLIVLLLLMQHNSREKCN